MKTICAGTFDLIHRGHRALLDVAIKMAGDDSLCIGITVLPLHRKTHPISPFFDRLGSVYDYVNSKVKFTMIDMDKMIPEKAYDRSLECIVCSTESYKGALKVNYARLMLDIPELLIVVVPVLYDYFGRKISTTNIYAGVIDREGEEVCLKKEI
jgi:pantetheine-phosphate adenylyltransferase